MSTSPPISPPLNNGGTISGNLTVTGVIESTAGAFPSILAPGGSVSASQFSSNGAPNAYDATGVGGGFRAKEGTNAKQGSATLVGGTIAVANTSVTANSRILLGHTTPGGTPGALFASVVTVGSGFTITSTSATDTSVVAYEIFEPG